MQNFIEWRPEIAPHLPFQHWQTPERDIAFFCDLHADAEAFLRSLKQGGLVQATSRVDCLQLTEYGRLTHIIIGGDMFDKGPSTLQLLRLINQLLQLKPDTILLAGNHDIRFLAGILALDHQHNPLQSHFFARMGKKAIGLLADIYREWGEHPSPNHQACFVDAYWPKAFKKAAIEHLPKSLIKKEVKQLHKKQADMHQAWCKRFNEPDALKHAISWAQHLFLDPQGEFGTFFKNLKLLHIEGSFLFSHAGIDDTLAQRLQSEGQDAINQDFQNHLTEGKLFELYYGALGNAFRTKYRKYDWPFSADGAHCLRSQNIFALVNGHRHHLTGQQIFVRNGLLNFECDTQLNSNCRKKDAIQTPGWGVTIFSSDGAVKAISSDAPQPKWFHPHFWMEDHGQKHTHLRA